MSNGSVYFELGDLGIGPQRKLDKCGEAVHQFERAGMGKAPFRVVGYGRFVYQAVPGDPSCPLQPGTSCDYCGTGCMDVAHIESSDGQKHKVGMDCVMKVGDGGLLTAIKKSPEYRKLQRDKRYARHERVREEVQRLMADDSVRVQIGESNYLSIENSLRYSGMAGYARNLRRLRELIAMTSGR